MKIIGLFFLLLLFFAPSRAQENCGLDYPPGLLDLKLQMSPEEVQNVFGKDLKIKVKKTSQKTIFQNYIEKPAPQSLAGVRALYLRFFDRKLYQIEIFYEESRELKTLTDFIVLLSARLSLSASVWQNVNGKAVINCGEFTLAADKILNPHIEITNEIARAKVEAIRQEKSKKK